jgi:hypothetical protein
MTTDEEKSFPLKQGLDAPERVGASWYHDALAAAADGWKGRPAKSSRRAAIKTMIWTGGAVVAAGVMYSVFRSSNRPYLPREEKTTASLRDAIDVQKKYGWNVGSPFGVMVYASAVSEDILGQPVTGIVTAVSAALAPSQARLTPFQVSTLFDAARATGPDGKNDLRTGARPIRTPEMDAAFGRGFALSEALGSPTPPEDTAVIVDLPGPQAVAAAAGLSGDLEPVFLFDNWPHPKGVVPSHLTLGAAIFYARLFFSAKKSRPKGAPPVFVLDANRLAPYTDEASQFDNRYVAKLPSVERLKAMGIKRVLYVRPDAKSLQDLDDVNLDLVAYKEGGVEIKEVALDDFAISEVELPPATTGGLPEDKIPAHTFVHHSVHRTGLKKKYTYLGASLGTAWFLHRYLGAEPPKPRSRRDKVVEPKTGSTAHTAAIVPRKTLFNPQGATSAAGRSAASVGKVMVNVGATTGAVVSLGRNGSLGRLATSSHGSGGRYSSSGGSRSYRYGG